MAKVFNPGNMRHKIQFQQFKGDADADGFSINSWVNIGNPVWAEINHLYGREFFAATAVQMENTIKIKIRFQKKITNDMAIVCGDKRYEIISIDDLKRNQYIEIKARESQLEHGSRNIGHGGDSTEA